MAREESGEYATPESMEELGCDWLMRRVSPWA